MKCAHDDGVKPLWKDRKFEKIGCIGCFKYYECAGLPNPKDEKYRKKEGYLDALDMTEEDSFGNYVVAEDGSIVIDPDYNDDGKHTHSVKRG